MIVGFDFKWFCPFMRLPPSYVTCPSEASKWSESIAVRKKSFAYEIHKMLGFRAKARKAEQVEESNLIREPVDEYGQKHAFKS